MNDLSPEKLEALLNGPALAPPAGVIPQFDNPPSHRTASIAIPTACLIVSTTLVAMRLYTSIRIIRQVDIADYSVFLGWAIFIGEIVCAFLAVKHAPGVHQWNVRLGDLGPFLYYFHVASVLYGICMFFVKFSILIQYIKIFMPIKKPRALYWTTIFIIAVNFIHYFIGRFIEIFSCYPIAKAWDPLITEGSCIDIKALISASASISAASDIIILILPQVVIWRLNLSRKEKAGISIIFLIAIFACVSSTICIFYSVVLQRQSDDTYYTWFTGLWTLLEMAAGFAVACLPVAKAFVKNLSKAGGFSSIASSTRKVTSTWGNQLNELARLEFGSQSSNEQSRGAY
ncbi:hypothetical protein F4815DRAFT_500560 [Daldinia loculata]|nr:hypothetical protein F4815DRAFT_500560 [Daldinia loculata]